MKGLYPIVNVRASYDVDAVEAYVQSLLTCRPKLLQLRAKELPREHVHALAICFARWLRGTPTELVINDYPDIAASVGAAWVHLGQGDGSVASVRSGYPGLKIGISTHSLRQLATAVQDGADYVALGPIWSTRTKVNAEPTVGLPMLAHASKALRESNGPALVAIGGIDVSNASSVSEFADMGAVVSCLERTDDVPGLCQALQRLLLGFGSDGGDGSAEHRGRDGDGDGDGDLPARAETPA
jgi:thiamine-phosphate pyrophosphorylase